MLQYSFIALAVIAVVLCAVVFFALLKYAKKGKSKPAVKPAVAEEEVTADVAVAEDKAVQVKKN